MFRRQCIIYHIYCVYICIYPNLSIHPSIHPSIHLSIYLLALCIYRLPPHLPRFTLLLQGLLTEPTSPVTSCLRHNPLLLLSPQGALALTPLITFSSLQFSVRSSQLTQLPLHLTLLLHHLLIPAIPHLNKTKKPCDLEASSTCASRSWHPTATDTAIAAPLKISPGSSSSPTTSNKKYIENRDII